MKLADKLKKENYEKARDAEKIFKIKQLENQEYAKKHEQDDINKAIEEILSSNSKGLTDCFITPYYSDLNLNLITSKLREENFFVDKRYQAFKAGNNALGEPDTVAHYYLYVSWKV